VNKKILRYKGVVDKAGISRSTMYGYIKQGNFPKPIRLGKRAVGWLEHEIDEWIAGCIKNRDRP
jgi:prophage regulatory protein